MKKISISFLFLLCAFMLHAQKQFTLVSPNGQLRSTIVVGRQLTYDIRCRGKLVMSPSAVAMKLDRGTVWGVDAKLAGTSERSVSQMVPSPLYRAQQIEDCFNELTLRFRDNWQIKFRAYDDGVAYRFVSLQKKPFRVVSETADYTFPEDFTASVPYVRTGVDGDFASQYPNSFENTYTTAKLSQLNPKRLIFLPMVVDAADGVKVCITETDLEDYPGMFLLASPNANRLTAHYAPYPKRVEQGGYNRLQMVVKEPEPYIARVEKPRAFPWRIAVVTTADKNLAASNLSYLLASPSRVADISWIKPGKVAWDWWNKWNLDGVDFETGINNDTYKAYIDFAAANAIEYIIMDEGWAVNMQADLMQVIKEIDLKELVDYGAQRHVGIILWAGYQAFARDMEKVCRHYSEMGIKGFKVDYMERDDQLMTAFNYQAAAMCAKYRLVLDLHGTHKPAGLCRTYPNVLNVEGVHGLEQMKWSDPSVDQVKYDVMIPFIRQVSGPMDYTQGAMRNASRGNYFPCHSEPMSQGTRCRQLALYVVLDAPLNMLCDAPTNYMREPLCTSFISAIPTVWDETRILDGKMGEYIVTARRKGSTWYVGGLTDWTERDIVLDLSFVGTGRHRATIYKDGVNAHRIGRDFKYETQEVDAATALKLHLAPGGGFAVKIE